jgi:hypothetical protein
MKILADCSWTKSTNSNLIRNSDKLNELSCDDEHNFGSNHWIQLKFYKRNLYIWFSVKSSQSALVEFGIISK